MFNPLRRESQTKANVIGWLDATVRRRPSIRWLKDIGESNISPVSREVQSENQRHIIDPSDVFMCLYALHILLQCEVTISAERNRALTLEAAFFSTIIYT